MSNQSGFVIENKFINGLVTESTALSFPEHACTDTYNCVFNEFGTVTRRPGIDIETDGGAAFTYTQNDGDIYTDYIWYTSAASSNQAYFVQQIGKTLYFFDITDSLTPSQNYKSSIDLDTFLPSGSSSTSANTACQFATGNGKLLVANQYLNPFYCTFNETTQTIGTTTIIVKHRDTDGLEDNLRVDERPTNTVANLKTDRPNHYYNLINQGWYNGDALSQWDSDNTHMPSNADVPSYYRFDGDDAYDEGSPAALNPGNSPAPKGHFILNVGEDDRTAAAATEGFTGFTLTGTTGSTMIGRSVGTIIGDFTSDQSALFDGTTNAAFGQSNGSLCADKTSTFAYAGKNYTTQGGFKISGAAIHPSNNQGYVSDSVNITVELYGKTSAPSSSTDGTLLGTTGSFADTTQSKFISSSDTTTVYTYVWLRVKTTSGSTSTFRIVEMQFFTGGGNVNRPRCVAFYAGRAWYAGVDGADVGSNIYFSQVCTQDANFGKCYQSNDPTSEKFADLLATDGGVIKIPEIGRVQKLFPFQNSLMIFAANGVWLVSGSGNDAFAATGYRVRRISNIGMVSPMSVVDVRGIPLWWAEDGIYSVSYDANYDSTTVKSITEETIKTFILSVPGPNKPYIKGTFDRLNNYVYFGFYDQEVQNQNELNYINTLLVFNVKTNAFFPWKWNSSTTDVPICRGVSFVADGDRLLGGKLKLPTSYDVSGTKSFTFAEFNDSTTFKDWTAGMLLNTHDPIDFSSYIVTSYRIDGQAMKNFQTKYVWTFMNTLANSSLWMRGLWAFTNSANSGKWSTPQQVYNSLTTLGRNYLDVRTSRRVVRGTGKALQLKYYSETGKPFELIGWGIFETGNDAA